MATTKYITWSGGPSGDYTCDGTNDEVQFNQAFTWGNSNPNNVIKMRGTGDASSPHKYNLQGPVKMCSNVVWTAETGVCLFIPNGACGTSISNCVFPNGTPVIGQLSSYITNVEIYGFEFDGNCQNQSTVLGKAHGKVQSAGSGVERLIQLRGLSGSQTKASNIYIHDINFHDAFGEAVHIQYAKGVRVESIKASNHQHDCVYYGEVSGDNNDLSGCTLYGITDSTIRLDNCQNIPVHDNYIYSYSGSNNNGAAMYGHNGIQIANNSGTYFTLHTDNITVYNNYFDGQNLCGIWFNDTWAGNTTRNVGSTAQNVHVHHNTFRNGIGWADWASWSSGISVAAWGNGIIIEYNLFDSCYANTIQVTSAISAKSTHTVTVRNNNIINTMGKRAGSTNGPSVQGWGIYNAIPTKTVVKSENNYMSGNLFGDYKGFTPSSTSDEPIESAGAYGGSNDDDSDDTVTPTVPPGIYIPTTAQIINTDFGYVQRAADDYRAYINGVPFDVIKYSGSGSKIISESHSPSMPGSNLGDLDFKGSDLELTCIAENVDEIDRVMAAFSQRGRSFLELGGPFKGYFVSGIMPTHGFSYDKSQGDIADEYLVYNVSFKTEFHRREWMYRTERGRYITSSGTFASGDIHDGNLVQNPNFSSWTPNHALNWKMITRDAEDSQWQNVKYSPELTQWCAVGKTGTNNRIMISGPQLVTDLSGDYHTGIYAGDVTPLSGGGLSFGGTDSYVDIPVPDIANSTNWTIYSKMSSTYTGEVQTLFGMGRSNSNTPLLVLWISATGHVNFWHRDDASTGANIVGDIVTDGNTYEICVVKDGTTYTLYIDGVQAGTTTATIGQTSVNGACIGRTPRQTELSYFVGNIYSTRIYSRSLASNEVVYAGNGTTGLLQAYASVITDDPGEFWAIPPSLARLSTPDLLWTGLEWCPDWHLWVAISSSQSGLDCAISPDGVSWTLKSTPLNREWSNCVFIPANETLPTGRLIVFAKSGTGAKTMYSDDQCSTWVEVDIPADVATNSIQASAYSPEHSRVVIVTSDGSATKRVIYTDDFGVTYVSVTAPAQKWIGITWASLMGLFVSCSIDGTQQIMTSPTGLEGTWELQDTPYASSNKDSASTVVRTLDDQTDAGVGYKTLATSYTDTRNPMVTFVLPALSNGNHYRLDNVRCRLKINTSGPTSYMKVTAQTATIAETILKEWPETATSYKDKSFDCVFEGGTDEAVTIRYYMKTTSGTVQAAADNIGYTASEMTAGSSTITYERNAWRDIAYARDMNLLAVVCQDTDITNNIMYSADAKHWYLVRSLAAQVWSSVEYSDDQKKFLAVSASSTYRVMESTVYGELVNIPPAMWTKVEDGQQASYLHTHDSDRSLLIEGDGTTECPGEIYQKLPLDNLYDPNELYIMLGYAYVSGLTSGAFRAELYAGGTIVKQLTWDTNTTDITEKEIKFKFSQIPSSAYIRIKGVNTPNNGAKFYCGFVLVSKMEEFENPDVGSEISTDGYDDCIPNVKLRGVGVTESSGTSNRIVDDTDSEVYDTESASYEYVKTVELPALTGGSKYQLNELAYDFKTDSVKGYVYCRVTIQAASLFGGLEKDIALYITNKTEYQSRRYTLSYELFSATNEVVTLRWYIKSTNSVTGFLTNVYYKLTEILDKSIVKSTPIYIYNNSDTPQRLQICNNLPQGVLVEINKDGTGAIRYSDPFEDDRYIDNAYKITGAVVRDEANQTLKMPANSSYEILFESLYAFVGVPFLKMFVVSGIPQISIAEYVDGEPGTYYSVDANTSDTVENTDIVRQLDNETNFRLRSLNKVFIKIAPLTGQSCVFSQLLAYSSTDTSDARRINIFAADKPNNIGVYVGGDGKCSAILRLEYRKTNVLH